MKNLFNPSQLLICIHLIFVLVPNTKGKLVKHTFDIDYAAGYPDGARTRWVLKINKKFPGPTIEAEVGDILQVDVINHIRDKQNTSIHWHGIHQQGSPFQDGPSMITQCPLKYGQTQRYQFKLEQWGTFWYHSHVRSQYSEGVWGALIIHPKIPPVHKYDLELVITLNDFYHTRSSELEEWYFSDRNTHGVTPYPDSVLLNGKGRYPCDKAQARNISCSTSNQRRHIFLTPAQKRIRIRLINTSSRTSFHFSIDSHPLETIEVDGIDVREPVTADVAHIAPAQRLSFIITTTQKTEDRFLIRAEADLDPSPDPETVQGQCPECTTPLVTAVLQYDRKKRKNPRIIKKTEIFEFYETIPPPPSYSRTLLDESLLLPYDRSIAPFYIDHNIVLNANIFLTEKGFRFAFNHTTFTLPEDEPILHKVVKGIQLPSVLPYIHLNLHSTVQIVINNFDGNHPYHMHGHHFWVVGKFPMRQDSEGNFLPFDEKLDGWKISMKAVQRDTVFVESNHILVIRFYADNFGVWAVHCHIDWHNLGGMGAFLIEGEEVVRQTLNISEEMKLICRE